MSEKIFFTLTPNPSKNPIMKFTTAWMIFFAKSMAFCKASFMCEKNPSKSPLKSAVNAWMIFVTNSTTFLIADMIGSAAVMIPFTMEPIYVRMNSKTGCSASNSFIHACFICSMMGFIFTHISDNACFTFARALSTFSLNSSFVL